MVDSLKASKPVSRMKVINILTVVLAIQQDHITTNYPFLVDDSPVHGLYRIGLNPGSPYEKLYVHA